MFAFRKKKKRLPPHLASAIVFTEESAARLAEEMFASMAGEFIPDDERFKFAVARMFSRVADDASSKLVGGDMLCAISARYAQSAFEARWRELSNALPPVEDARKQ